MPHLFPAETKYASEADVFHPLKNWGRTGGTPVKTMVAFSAAIIFTGCPDSFGKDDFYGYWRTTDFVNGERIDYYHTTVDGADVYYQIEWDFNGTSENAFSNGGTFKQHLRRATSADNLHDGVLSNETFWTGRYQLKGNSGYSAGSLILYYEYGVQLKDKDATYKSVATFTGNNSYTYDVVKGWSEADFLNMWKYKTLTPSQIQTGLALLGDSSLQSVTTIGSDGSSGSFANGIYVQSRYISGTETKEYGDIEYFRYRLEDGTMGGYARMLTTTVGKDGTKVVGGLYNQWNQDSTKSATTEDSKLGSHSNTYGWKNSSECSWAGTNYRALGLVKKNSGEWASNDSRTNAQLYKITYEDENKRDKISTINNPGDNDPTTDEQYSNIDR